jgi:hypothetical protein
MTTKHLLLPALAVVLVLGVIGCSPTPKPTSPEATPSVEATSSPEVPAAAEETPTIESLAGAELSQMQEGLVFDYLRAGGMKALESRFGKPTKLSDRGRRVLHRLYRAGRRPRTARPVRVGSGRGRARDGPLR